MAYNLTTSGLTLGSDVFTNAKDVGLAAYPVGSIYMSTNSTSPATLFGGTWEALDEGRVLIGCNDTYPAGSTGGEEKHKLSISELPSHNHKTVGHIFGTFPVWVTNSQKSYLKDPNLKPQFIVESINEINGPYFLDRFNDTIDGVSKWDTGASGNDSPHNNMPPYLSVYMWKRTA